MQIDAFKCDVSNREHIVRGRLRRLARASFELCYSMSPSKAGSEPPPESQRTFGKNLKAARTAAGMSQDDLAKASGRSRSLVYETEEGKRNLLFSTAESLARALGITVLDLLQLTPLPSQPEEPDAHCAGTVPVKSDTIAIELPTSLALDAAIAVATKLNKSVTMIDPVSREIKGTVPKPRTRPQD